MATGGAQLDASVIKKTQETLGKLIKKPALTEKLLKKPPFRFLHDIMKSILKETGYFEGLYTKSELDSENIKDRDAKMQFLQKLIDVLKIATDQEISARPSKIVAGHEPEKTNELLQLIASVISNKVDCKKAVEIVKNGGQKPKVKEKKEPTKQIVEKTSKVSKNPVEKNKKVPDKKETKGKVSSKNVEKKTEKIKKSSTKESDRGKIKKVATKEVPLEIERPKEENALTEDSQKLLENMGNNLSNSLNEEHLSKEKNSTTMENNEEIKKDDAAAPQIEPDIEQENKNSIPSMSATESSLNEKRSAGKRRKSSASIKSGSENIQVKNGGEISKSNSAVERSVAISQSEDQKSLPSSSAALNNSENNHQVSDVKRQSTFVRENSSEISNRPRTSLRPPSVRPASARPGAPRRRDKNVEIILQPHDSVKMAGINVKLENFTSELEDDGENLIIIDNSSIRDNEIGNKPKENDVVEQQGHLVQQILETQKELVQSDEKGAEKEFENISTLQNRQSSAKQMNSLRDVIQNLTRSINPLGKLMDFIPEDIDSMQLELSMWRDSYSQASNELRKERSHTESALEPMKNQLAQINAAIKEHIEMINASRAKILQNSEKIFKLLTE